MSSKLKKIDARTAWVFLLPACILLFLVALYPLFKTLSLSFTDAGLMVMDSTRNVGLGNYVKILQDDLWWNSVRNTVFFTIASVGIETMLGLAFALLLHHSIKGRGILRAAILIPWAIPVVVSAKIWEWMLNDQFGIINQALESLGLIGEGVAWMSEPGLALWVIVIIDVWITTPFMVLLTLAGLQMIPNEVIEASKVDGVSPIRRFVFIILPLLRPALGVAILFRTLDALRMFDLSYVLGGNGKATMTVSIFARNELVAFQSLGRGSAASTLVFFLIAFASIALIYIFRINKSTKE